MARLPRITAAEPLPALAKEGWQISRQKGSHAQLRHPTKPNTVTAPRHAGEIIKPRILAGILEKAGLTAEELRRLL